jgi:hypothetical protein
VLDPPVLPASPLELDPLSPDELLAVLAEPVPEEEDDDDCDDDESELLELVLLEEELPVSLEPVELSLPEPEPAELLLLPLEPLSVEFPVPSFPAVDCSLEGGACCCPLCSVGCCSVELPLWVSCVLVWFCTGCCCPPLGAEEEEEDDDVDV